MSEPGQFECVIHQDQQAMSTERHRAERSLEFSGHRSQFLVPHHRQIADQRRERRTQFMGDQGEEIALALGHLTDLLLLTLDGLVMLYGSPQQVSRQCDGDGEKADRDQKEKGIMEVNLTKWQVEEFQQLIRPSIIFEKITKGIIDAPEGYDHLEGKFILDEHPNNANANVYYFSGGKIYCMDAFTYSQGLLPEEFYQQT